MVTYGSWTGAVRERATQLGDKGNVWISGKRSPSLAQQGSEAFGS